MSCVILAAALHLQWIVWPALFVVLCLGLLAAFLPHRFSQISAGGAAWYDTNKFLQFLDRPIDVDRHVLRYSRAFGVVVTLAALWLAFVCWAYVF